MKILCIGGLKDGDRFEDLGRAYVIIPIYKTLGFVSASADDTFETETYRRETIRSGRGEIAFYVHEPMDTFTAIQRLFARYPIP